MNDKKFRVWRNDANQFEYFELHNITVPERLLVQHKYPVQQFIGILDKNLREIYERDVVKFFTLNGEELGEVIYSTDSCAYYINDYPIMNLDIASLEIVGNMVEDYMWDESGERLIKTYEDANS